MKKLITLVVTVIFMLAATSTHIQYSVPNALYRYGEIITPLDQNIWWYESDDVPNICVVTVIFDDNSTPNNIYDDIIVDIIPQ